jgi:hypothetical protein
VYSFTSPSGLGWQAGGEDSATRRVAAVRSPRPATFGDSSQVDKPWILDRSMASHWGTVVAAPDEVRPSQHLFLAMSLHPLSPLLVAVRAV